MAESTHQEQEEKHLYIDATITVNVSVRGVEYPYQGDIPDRELLREHIAELFRCETFISDNLEVKINHIDAEEA